jgi:proliferating cell nuclear antigen
MVNNDSLTLYIEENDKSKLGITIHNEDTNKVTNYKLNLMDIDEGEIEAPGTDFGSIITMPSSEFQKICRDASAISDVIEIKSVDQQLIFSCHGDFASQETVYGETTSGISFAESEDNTGSIVQGYYNLKFLVLFSKCANLCQSVKMFLDNEFPIVIEFAVGSLGYLKMALAPKVQE